MVRCAPEISTLGVCLVAFAIGAVTLSHPGPAPAADEKSGKIACDADRAFGYLSQICKFGARPSGSEGMDQQQQLLVDYFTRLGGQPRFQTFDTPHPVTRRPVRMSNLVVSWHPESKQRVLLCCHYDTRPLPDRDSNPNLVRNGTFVGANDGASGVALLMELGQHIRDIKPTYGVDFVFFDGEELVYGEADEYFHGSTYFAKQYRDQPPAHEYLYGVLVDMIGDKKLAIYQEVNSLRYAPQLTRSIWDVAARLGVKEFIAQRKHLVNDDHLPLNQIANIPACDLIDFDYPHWHTTQDTPANCSGESLAKVGNVLLQWLQEVPAPAKGRGK